MDNKETVSLERAIELGCAYASPLYSETILLAESLNRVAAGEIHSTCQVPSFSRSKVDGFTLTQSDLLRLRSGNCLDLQVINTIPAGWVGEAEFIVGQSIRIMTGAIIPHNTAAIVKQEDVQNRGDTISLTGPVDYKQYIEPPGSEIEVGETIISDGQEVDAGVIERLASAGETGVKVYSVPRVYIINCGDELRLPGQTLQKGQIYHSNRNFMLAKVQVAHCQGILGNAGVGDNLDSIIQEIHTGIKEGDLLIISGGTAQGKYDLVADALQEMKAEFLFHSIASKPGRNINCSLLQGHLVFNLPGHPSAGGVIFDLLLTPVLRKMRGLNNFGHNWLNLSLSAKVNRKRDIRSFRRGELVQDNLTFLARPLGNHENQAIIPLLMDIEAGQGEKGDMVKA
ncbi:MAG: molybdopterin molybdotransferase MoeA, partial [Syntrophomonadaceae bacterium]|nr:molybdopterin molybdotransferase MoeA [Syntrophomonadaceae bacterium]